MRRFGVLVGALIVVAGVASGTGAQAATGDDVAGGSSAQQRQQEAVAAWTATASNVTRDGRSLPASSAGKVTAASSGGTRTMKLYRGSWLMWAQETVQYKYSGDGRTVTSSAAWQDSGWVFPNNVKEGGTQRFYKSSTLHSWRGKYSVGAGVPTPWGNANVYSASSVARSDIKNIGSIQWWQN